MLTESLAQLPWATSNEDLVELFQTIGGVQQAEIQYESDGRSRGSGVVRLETPEIAETAIAKFTDYNYGGRPLHLSFVKYSGPPGAPTGPSGGNSSMGGDAHMDNAPMDNAPMDNAPMDNEW